ncbi:substrate-binding periplasmic protein [Corynebacterium epidermidicanis]|uniref:Extracellular solute-binding protein, family 3 n=1 Tax=Corynebacterium epidermidicanis TaxID=1050174 RepID=A0A0G3GSZ5_9CORY|nr:transporter substrate-binding domain-containing protein [Corynebacterium epidermidicanis]AKK04249.1 extracellular solute-binding protein, family 3 [Corynebacterium epidermidicanis]
MNLSIKADLTTHRINKAVLAALLTLGLASCSTLSALPKDSEGALHRAQHEELRVGVTEHLPYTDVHDDGAVTGSEAQLIDGFAQSIGTKPRWVPGSEEALVKQLEDGEIDVIIGGLTKKTQWSKKVALTRPYDKETKTVMAVPMGENALLTSLERYLAETTGEVQ